MKLKYNFLALLAAILCFTSCQKVYVWEEADLEYVDIYYIQPTDGSPYAYSVYHQINSLLEWSSYTKTTSNTKIGNFVDESEGEDVIFSFEETLEVTTTTTDEEGVETTTTTEEVYTYAINSTNEYNYETGDLNAALGTLTITSPDGSVAEEEVYVYILQRTLDLNYDYETDYTK